MPFTTDPDVAYLLNDTYWLDATPNPHNLIAVGAPAVAAGVVGNGAVFGGAADALYAPDHEDFRIPLTIPGALELIFWFKLNSKLADMTLISKQAGASGTDRGWRIYYKQSTDRLVMEVCNAAGITFSLEDIALGSPPTGTWVYYRALFMRDGSLPNSFTLGAASEGCTANSIGTVDSTFGVPNVEAGPLVLGAEKSGSGYANWLDGMLDIVYIWRSRVTDDDCEVAYDGGVGYEPETPGYYTPGLINAVVGEEEVRGSAAM